MASIRKRTGAHGDTWAVLYRQDGRQRSRTFTTERAAQEHAARIERLGLERADRLLDAESHAEAGALTVAGQVARHVAALSGVQPYTITTYTTMQRQLEQTALGQLPLVLATRDDVAAWIRDQEAAGAAAKTIRNRHALLSAALTRAVEDGLATRNVAARAKITRTVREEMTFLTAAEMGALLGRVTPHYRPLIATLYGTGMRLGEATALQVQDVNIDGLPPTIRVVRAWKKHGEVGPPKTAMGRRTIALPVELAPVLAAAIDGKDPTDLVFTNVRGGRVLQATLHDAWQGWIADTTLVRGEPVQRLPRLGKRPRIHDLRHSHAAAMIAAGMDLTALRQRLGHESITTTVNTYGHLQPDVHLRAAAAASAGFVGVTLAIAPQTAAHHPTA